MKGPQGADGQDEDDQDLFGPGSGPFLHDPNLRTAPQGGQELQTEAQKDDFLMTKARFFSCCPQYHNGP